MHLMLCSIRDQASEAWQNPITFQSTGQAVRSFSDAVNKEGSDFNLHPGDYTLFCLGTFNPETGDIEPHVQPENLANGINLIVEK